MKSTKKSLWMSILSLILCFTMLLGTTWAWFTDEVTSGVNKIVAGNLDVELVHSNGKVTDESVAGSTELFKTDLWEPGKVVYENFTVKNVGNLALKYSVQITAWDYNTVTVDGETYDLRDVIKVAVIDSNNNASGLTSGTPYAFSGDRAAAQELTYGAFGTYSITDKALAAAQDDTFAIVLYWEPTDNDNIYNINNGKQVDELHDGKNELFIDFGINLVATQQTSEKDSFDELYDETALNPVLSEFIHEKATGTFTKSDLEDTASSSSVELTTTADIGITAKVDKSVAVEELNKILGESEQGAAEDTHLVLNLNVATTELSERSVTYDITMDGVVTTTKDGQMVVRSAKITSVSGYVFVDMEIGANLVNVLMTHSGVPMTKVSSINALPNEGDPDYNASGYYSYNMDDGILHIATKSFSPFKVTYEIPDIITVPDGETFDLKTKLASDVTVTVADDTVASVDDNLILTAKNAGQTTLTIDYGSSEETCMLNVTLFHGGTGAENDPFMIANRNQMQNISKCYSAGCYDFKLLDGVTEIDCSGWIPINLYGNFDGNGVTFKNLTASLFYKAKQANGDCYISNMRVEANIEAAPDEACAVCYDSLSGMYLKDIFVTGYLEGGGWTCPFISWVQGGTGTSVTFDNCNSDATIVCTSGQCSGFVGHPTYPTAVDNIKLINSRYTGHITATEVWNARYLSTNSYPKNKVITDDYSAIPDDWWDGGNVNYQYKAEGKVAKIATVAGSLPESLGDVFSINATDGATKAQISLIASPNGPDESGCYTGLYMTEEMELNGNVFTSKDIRYFNVRVNPDGATSTGVHGCYFDIVNSSLGHTLYYNSYVKVVQYDANNCVLAVTHISLEDKND